MVSIRPITDADWDAVWTVLEPVFRAGETYAYPIDITKDQARAVWVDQPAATFVAEDAGLGIVGTYILKPNQPGRGAHVCNCGYVVSEAARGQGVASAMCDHSQEQARAMGFRAMQYNLVVATNEGAVRLWQSKGFDIVGTLPGAFDHPRLGFVDAHVMYKVL
ncbi:MAG: GNAT family N-acetyltransferase [Rhodospirillaceae bacterium]|nr:GNAT family N-acetyltransferase [Rhodospirillaceae bacterium]